MNMGNHDVAGSEAAESASLILCEGEMTNVPYLKNRNHRVINLWFP